MEEYDFLLFKGNIQSADASSALDRFISAIETHVAHEGAFLQEYSDAISRHDSPLVRFILELILADEEKHHELLARIVARLDADINRRKRTALPIPVSTIGSVDSESLVRLTNRFLDEERAGIAMTKSLMKTTDKFYDGLLTMLLGGIVKDSEKHILMLKFLRQRLR